MPLHSNLITMARSTLGLPGQLFAWFFYLLLLYSLIAAYLAGGTEVVNSLLNIINIKLPTWLDTFLFLILLGFFVYQGIRSVDWLNRGLMCTKLAVFFLLVILASFHIQTNKLMIGSVPKLLPAVMIVITAFGFSIIIPSLRIYLHNDIKKLRITILVGSFIALFCYITWLLVIQGNIATYGPTGLVSIASSKDTVGNLTTALIQKLHTPLVITFIHFFTSICMITSFLGVSLSLTDFLADGLQVSKKGKGNLVVYGLTFIPPLIIVLFIPSIFIKALDYAGIICVILLILLPAIMAWRSRQLITKSTYQVWGKNYLLSFVIIASIILLIIAATN